MSEGMRTGFDRSRRIGRVVGAGCNRQPAPPSCIEKRALSACSLFLFFFFFPSCLPFPRRRQSQCSGGGGCSGSCAAVLLCSLSDGSGICGPRGLLLRGTAGPRGALPDAQPPARRGAAQPAARWQTSCGLARRTWQGAAPGRLHLSAPAQAPPPGGGPAPDQSRGRGRGPATPEQRAPAAARRVPAPRRRAARA